MRAGGAFSRPILIAGAGIGGLAAALALAQRGYKCRVLDRKGAPDEAGAGIQIGPNGVCALRALGVAASLEPQVGKPSALCINDARRGRSLATLPLGETIADRLGAPYWTAHRADLHGALLAHAEREPGIVIQWGFEVGRLEATQTGVQVTSTAAAIATGAALIGADGVWSKVRGYVTDGIEMTPTGKRAFRSVVPTGQLPTPFQANVVGLWLAPGIHVVHYPVCGGRDTAIVVIVDGVAQSQTWTHAVDGAFVRACVRNLAPELAAFLAIPQHWASWGLTDCKALPRWSNGRVTLVGDAAHPILPFLAQGGVLALEDGVTLADEIARSSGDLALAFESYAKSRMARTKRVAATARRNGTIYHLSGAPALARNLVLKGTSPARLIALYDWLYGWKPAS